MSRRRKKVEEEHENHERWLVSYADFITLLFAFFVVMYAVSSVNEGKYRVLSNSITSAFGRGAALVPAAKEIEQSALPALPLPLSLHKRRAAEAAIRREREQLSAVTQHLMASLAPLIDQGQVRVMQTARGITVEINASVLFAPGEAKLSGEASDTLKAVAKVVREQPFPMQVEGHTDNVPISNPYFPSNWELSAVRASSVVRLFIESGIAENRLTAIGHGETRPVSSNDTVEGRLRNRRVQLMILSALPDIVTESVVDSVGR